MEKPKGLWVVSFLFMASGALQIYWTFDKIGLLYIEGNLIPEMAFNLISFLIIGSFVLFIGWGVWNLKKWAWKLGVGIAIFMTVWRIVALIYYILLNGEGLIFLPVPYNLTLTFVELIMNIAIVWYLFARKSLFERQLLTT